jgi:aldehyde:ferredoxin oxidoreductase
MSERDSFRVLVCDLSRNKNEIRGFGSRNDLIGGSGLAAGLFNEFGHPDKPSEDPDQPLIFAIGPLTGYFPLMSKVVLGFKSPYNEWYAESHAGGRMALAMKFAGFDAILIKGRAPAPSCLVAGARTIELINVHYLWGKDSMQTGKWLRKIHKSDSGHRSIIRIGPAGENRVSYASINVDSYRHFGRLGAGAIMGAKNLKGLITVGDGNLDLPGGRDFQKFYKEIYKEVTESSAMRKYHDLGTAENLLPLNEMGAIPWRNMKTTQDPNIDCISGEKFAKDLLLRKTACAGCPVGCIHVGLLRERFGIEHEFLYKQVSYDYEPIFSAGAMLGVTDAEHVLLLLESMERQGLDVISAGVALAWATEALEKGLISERETICKLSFGDVRRYEEAVDYLGARENDFYRILGHGVAEASNNYGGRDLTCVLGQEMAGYATGETFFVSQAYGFRHSHLDSAGYGFDQSHDNKDVSKAVEYMIEEERGRVGLTSMVSCLFARKVYTEERLEKALSILGHEGLASDLQAISARVQALRWRMKFDCGYDPDQIRIPKKFHEVVNWKGGIDSEYMNRISEKYAESIRGMASSNSD